MKKKLIKLLIKIFLPHLKVWGVEFDLGLPPEFYISDHANQRMKERFKCSETKIKKIAIKAWNSKQPVDEYLIYKKKLNPEYKKCIYKMFHGHIFVFSQNYLWRSRMYQKNLITVFKPGVCTN